MRALNATSAVFGLVLTGTIARSQEARQPVDVNIHVEGASVVPKAMYRAAKDTVSSIFARTGVRIAWFEGKRSAAEAYRGPVAVQVCFVRQSVNQASSGPFAYAFPFAGETEVITILYDRIRLAAGGWAREQHLLAHVLAHEIGHVLQGSNGHSATGVMKAHWDVHDYDAMQRNPLEFTPGDVNMIRRGLARLEAAARHQRR
jgi:predicted metalloprotease